MEPRFTVEALDRGDEEDAERQAAEERARSVSGWAEAGRDERDRASGEF